MTNDILVWGFVLLALGAFNVSLTLYFSVKYFATVKRLNLCSTYRYWYRRALTETLSSDRAVHLIDKDIEQYIDKNNIGK